MKRPNIYLMGFMGAGKSTVGRIVAEKLGTEFYDTDSIVEGAAGRTIPEIFAQDGEEVFRQLETKALSLLTKREGVVVAVGGGAPLREENWALMKKTGVSIYLRETATALFRRLAEGEDRPLLSHHRGEERLAKIRELLKFREPRYLEADLVVECCGRPPEEIATEILARIKCKWWK